MGYGVEKARNILEADINVEKKKLFFIKGNTSRFQENQVDFQKPK